MSNPVTNKLSTPNVEFLRSVFQGKKGCLSMGKPAMTILSSSADGDQGFHENFGLDHAIGQIRLFVDQRGQPDSSAAFVRIRCDFA